MNSKALKAFFDRLIPVVQTYLKSNYLKGKKFSGPWNAKDTQYFARGVKELNRVFTSHRGERNFNYLSKPELRSGYLAYFLLVNAAKAFSLFQKHEKIWKNKKKLSWFDWGCGPLTLSIALLGVLKEQGWQGEVEIYAVEQNDKILKDGVSILRNAFFDKNDKSIKISIKPFPFIFRKLRLPPMKADLFLLGNIINEVPSREQQMDFLIKMMERHLKDKGSAFIMEPATKRVSRDLQWIRDELLKEHGLYTLGPCLHQRECPLNQTAKGDWCHHQEMWKEPKHLQQLDRAAGIKKTYLQYSYQVLTRDTSLISNHSRQEFLAISDVMKAKGHDEIVTCGPAGRIRFKVPTTESEKFHRGILIKDNDLTEKFPYTYELTRQGKGLKPMLPPKP